MKLRIFLFATIAFSAIGQTTYQSSKYKPVWYSSTYEKTHGTYALFDTSSIKLYWTTSGKPEMKFFGPTGNTLFYLDSTGTISTGTTSGGLLKADFDDSLNNAHTITGAWKFNGAVGAIPAGSASIGKNATQGYLKLTASNNDTMTFSPDGSYGYINASDGILLKTANGNRFLFNVTGNQTYVDILPATQDARSLGSTSAQYLKYFGTDSVILGGKGQGATFWWGQSRQLTASDSCGLLTMSSGNPVITLYATDGDNHSHSVNTYDQAVFTGASGGYIFDSMIRNRDTDSDTFAVNPKGFSATNTMATGAIAFQLKDGATNLANIDTTGKMTLAGDLVYDFVHFAAHKEDTTLAVNCTATNVYTKILPKFVTGYGLDVNEGFTFAGDSLTVITPGDYIVTFGCTFSGSTGDDYKVGVFKNSVKQYGFRRTTTGATNFSGGNMTFHLSGLVAGDDISFKVCNMTAPGTNDPTFTNFNLWVYKIP